MLKNPEVKVKITGINNKGKINGVGAFNLNNKSKFQNEYLELISQPLIYVENPMVVGTVGREANNYIEQLTHINIPSSESNVEKIEFPIDNINQTSKLVLNVDIKYEGQKPIDEEYSSPFSLYIDKFPSTVKVNLVPFGGAIPNTLTFEIEDNDKIVITSSYTEYNSLGNIVSSGVGTYYLALNCTISQTLLNVSGGGSSTILQDIKQDSTTSSNSFLQSNDGETWNLMSYIDSQGNVLMAGPTLCFAGNRFFSIGNDSFSILVSKNGLVWENIYIDFFDENNNILNSRNSDMIKYICYDSENQQYLMLSYLNASTFVIYYSTNLKDWKYKTSFDTGDESLVSVLDRIVCHYANYFVYSTKGRNLFYSNNLETFTEKTNYYGAIDVQVGEGDGDDIFSIVKISGSKRKVYLFSNIDLDAIEVGTFNDKTLVSLFRNEKLYILNKEYSNYSPDLYEYYDLSNISAFSKKELLIDKNSEIDSFCVLTLPIVGMLSNIDGTNNKFEKYYINIYLDLQKVEGFSNLSHTMSNYKDSSIYNIHYAEQKDTKYNGILLSTFSSHYPNENGNYTYNSKPIIISGDKIHCLLIYFNRDDIFPTKIKINGIEYDNDSNVFFVDFHYGKYDNIVLEFIELNKSNSQLGIGSITNDANVVFSKETGLKDVTYEGNKKGLPYYGIISYGGDCKIRDKDGIIDKLSKLNLLPNVSTQVLINNQVKKNFSIGNNIGEDSKNKEVKIVLIDEIEKIQSIKNSSKFVFSNISGLEMFNVLANKFGLPIVVNESCVDMLEDIQINKVVIQDDSWWKIWEDFCMTTMTILVSNPNGYFEIRG